jgi:hypothetical protein
LLIETTKLKCMNPSVWHDWPPDRLHPYKGNRSTRGPHSLPHQAEEAISATECERCREQRRAR